MRKFLVIIAACLGLAFLFFIDQWQVRHWQAEKAIQQETVLTQCRINMENAFSNRFTALESLASLFTLHPETGPKAFAKFAASLLRFHPPMRAVQYADPATRVTYVYPPRGNEITIKTPMVLIRDPKRGPFTRKAIETRQAVLQGPFTLRQGGTGIVVRFPIYRKKRFLGLAIGVYDLNTLISEAMKGLDLNTFCIALSTPGNPPFWQSGTSKGKAPARQIRVADTNWQVSAGWKHPQHPPVLPRAILWLLGSGLFGSVLFLLRIQLRAEQDLAKKVDQRTRDLTRTHEALKESEEKYRLALDATSDGIWDWDIATGHVFFSRNWAVIMGEKAVAPAYQTWESRIHPLDRERVLASIRQHLAGQQDDWQEAHRLKTGSGEWKWVLGRGRIVERDDHGAPVRMVGTMTDISEQKKAEEELKAQRHLFEIMFNTIPDGVVITDENMQIRLANKSMAAIFGYSPEELNKKATRFLLADDKARNEASLPDEGPARPDNLFITYYRKKDEKTFAGETFGAKLRDEGDQRIGNLIIIRDITERLDTEKRLQQAQKMESIGNLAGGIAHDFNNILYPIIGMAELLMDDLAPETSGHEGAKEILNAGIRGSELVKQILAFSRQTEHRFLPILPQKILREALKLARATIPADIEIKEEILRDCGRIWADPTQIHQVVMNIITNAFHALEEGGGAITVRLTEQVLQKGDLQDSRIKAGTYACLSISDTGHGIPAEVIDNIFDPYFTTKIKGKGTGLGLSVVYGIIKEHKGDIKVYSEPGAGTCFTTYLPLMETTGDAETGEQPAPLVGGTERILVVDDEKAIQKLVRATLQRLGYHVRAFADSHEALAAFKASPKDFDLVVSDMSMPRMTGDQLAREIKAVRPTIPVIICTGFSERLSSRDSLPEIDGILMKPVIKSELASMVRKHLDPDNAPAKT